MSIVTQAFLIFFLLTAAVIDVFSNKIPNYLVLTVLIIGVFSQVTNLGFDGLTNSLSGVCVGLACFLPFYLKRGMGAGDVKLMAAVGSFLGTKMALLAVAYTLIFGGLFAFAVLLIKGNTRLMLARFYYMTKATFATGKLIYFPPGENEPSEIRFAYATAIAMGTLLVLYQYDIVTIGFL